MNLWTGQEYTPVDGSTATTLTRTILSPLVPLVLFVLCQRRLNLTDQTEDGISKSKDTAGSGKSKAELFTLPVEDISLRGSNHHIRYCDIAEVFKFNSLGDATV